MEEQENKKKITDKLIEINWTTKIIILSMAFYGTCNLNRLDSANNRLDSAEKQNSSDRQQAQQATEKNTLLLEQIARGGGTMDSVSANMRTYIDSLKQIYNGTNTEVLVIPTPANTVDTLPAPNEP